jgi:peptidase YpeB-like protein
MITKCARKDKCFILSLLILIVIGLSVHNQSTIARADYEPISLLPNYTTSPMMPVFPQSTSLPKSLSSTFTNLGQPLNNTSALLGQPLNNTSALPDPLLVERNRTGSIPTFPTIIEAFKSQIKTSLNEATTIALDDVGENSTAISSTLQPDRGFLVYIVQVVDVNNQIHSVVVDAGDGRVLGSILPPTLDAMQMSSRPMPSVPSGPVGPISGGGYSIPPLPPPLPNSGYAVPPLPIQPNPNSGGPMQPIQPPMPAR